MKKLATLALLLVAAAANAHPPPIFVRVRESDGSPTGIPRIVEFSGCTVAYSGSTATVTCNASAGDFVGPASSTDNAIVRFDGTTGKLGQNSIVGIADTDALATPAVALLTDLNTGISWVSGADELSLVAGGIRVLQANTTASGINYLNIDPGASGNPVLLSSTQVAGTGGISVIATAPAAAAGASVAGKPVAITASAAVASTDTAGAAAGGDITITGGAAARLTSGNANGGNVVVVPGAGVGTGTVGVLALGGTTSSFPAFTPRTGSGQIQLTEGTRAGRGTAWVGALGIGPTMDNYSAVDAYLTQTGNSGSSVRLSSGNALGWTSGADGGQTPDVGLARVAANVVKLTTGGTTLGGWEQWAGQCEVASDQTNSTTTPASSTCSISVTSGRKYNFECAFFFADSVAAEGARFDFDGGAATVSAFRTHSKVLDAALVTSVQTTALATDVTAATTTGDALFEAAGSFTASSTNTWIPRFAQNTHATGTITLYAHSHCRAWDQP